MVSDKFLKKVRKKLKSARKVKKIRGKYEREKAKYSTGFSYCNLNERWIPSTQPLVLQIINFEMGLDQKTSERVKIFHVKGMKFGDAYFFAESDFLRNTAQPQINR